MALKKQKKKYHIYLLLTVKNTTEKYSLNSTDKRGNEHGEITTADT